MATINKSAKKSTVSKKFIKNLYYDDDQRRLTKLVKGKNFDFFIMSVILKALFQVQSLFLTALAVTRTNILCFS